MILLSLPRIDGSRSRNRYGDRFHGNIRVALLESLDRNSWVYLFLTKIQVIMVLTVLRRTTRWSLV